MSYRRIPRLRRYFTSSIENNKENIQENKSVKPQEEIKKLESIPLPNEEESNNSKEEIRFSAGMPSFLSSLTKNIGIDEIILIAIIFLLLQEKIEDEFLLIILVYLLLTGRE